MLKEIAILLGLLVCMFFFVPVMTSSYPIQGIGMLSLFGFIGFLLYGGFHSKWLLDNHGRDDALLFLLILLLTIIVGSLVIWLLVPFQQV